MRRSGPTVAALIAGIVAGCGGGCFLPFAPFAALFGIEARLDEARRPRDTVMVIVAARPLLPGWPISEEDLYAVQIAPRHLPDGVFLSPDDVVGLRPQRTLLADELVRAERLSTAPRLGLRDSSWACLHGDLAACRAYDAAERSVVASGDPGALGQAANLRTRRREPPVGAEAQLAARLHEGAALPPNLQADPAFPIESIEARRRAQEAAADHCRQAIAWNADPTTGPAVSLAQTDEATWRAEACRWAGIPEPADADTDPFWNREPPPVCVGARPLTLDVYDALRARVP